MARLEIFAVGLLLAVAFNFVACSSDEIESDLQVSVVPDMDKYLMENPGLKVEALVKDTQVNGPSQYATLTYRLGRRIAGDRLVTTGSASQRWNRAQNVKQNLNYPRSGIGAVVTYIEIGVNQSTNLGRAYVVSGGIGQRRIGVVIEAQSTLYFTYKASIFGY